MMLRQLKKESGEVVLQQHAYSYKYKKGYGDYTHYISLKEMNHDPRLTLKEMVWVDVPIVTDHEKEQPHE